MNINMLKTNFFPLFFTMICAWSMINKAICSWYIIFCAIKFIFFCLIREKKSEILNSDFIQTCKCESSDVSWNKKKGIKKGMQKLHISSLYRNEWSWIASSHSIDVLFVCYLQWIRDINRAKSLKNLGLLNGFLLYNLWIIKEIF